MLQTWTNKIVCNKIFKNFKKTTNEKLHRDNLDKKFICLRKMKKLHYDLENKTRPRRIQTISFTFDFDVFVEFRTYKFCTRKWF